MLITTEKRLQWKRIA